VLEGLDFGNKGAGPVLDGEPVKTGAFEVLKSAGFF
jgi:hypothetical protein